MSALWASATEHRRESVKRASRRTGRHVCGSGCPHTCTHAGLANGVCLMIGCQFHVAMWVRDPGAHWLARRRGVKP